jgi:DNA-binding MarR family transcriptional regulator
MKRRGWASGEIALLQEVYSTGALVGFLVNRELEADGISPRRFSFLGWVSLLEPVTPSAFSEETGMPPTTIRDFVREVVARGDARKVRNPDDGRSYLLELTEQGRELIEAGKPALRRAYEKLEPGLRRSAGEYVEAAVELRLALREALAAPAARSSRVGT